MDPPPSPNQKLALGFGLGMSVLNIGFPGWKLVALGLTAYGTWRLAGNRPGTWVVVVLAALAGVLDVVFAVAGALSTTLPPALLGVGGALYFLLWPSIALVGFEAASRRGLVLQERGLAWTAVGWLAFLVALGTTMAILHRLQVTGVLGVVAVAAFSILAIVTLVAFPHPDAAATVDPPGTAAASA